MKNKKFGFTLAEVLITLAIIGVVAALTLPILINNHNKKTIETKLIQFNAMMTEAIRLSVVENGPIRDWETMAVSDSKDSINWINKYVSKYIKTTNIEECTSGSTNAYPSGCITFLNGSGVAIHNHVWFFYPDAKKIGKDGLTGKDFFAFYLDKKNERVIPFPATPEGKAPSLSILKIKDGYGCNKDNTPWCSGWFCTELIYRNGWKIPSDYPYRF